MESIGSQQVEPLLLMLARWGELWGVPRLEDRLTLEFSSRLKTTLGRCMVGQGRIRLAASLLEVSRSFLEEVVCHEAAHVAVYELYGKGPRPHGAAWKALMKSAGYEPRARIHFEDLPEPFARRGRPRTLWRHRCPVCQAFRIARRPVRNWRCAACHAAGLDGRLVVTRVTGAPEGYL